MRKINDAGLALVKEFEAIKPKAYLDPVGILTVGVGHVVLPEDNIRLGQVISSERVDDLLREDLSIAEQGVENALTEEVTDNQFAACVALAFNIGVGGFKKSSIVKFINAGDVSLAADRFLLYNQAKGKVLAGLTRRRKAERALFLTDDELDGPASGLPAPVESGQGVLTESTVIKTTQTEDKPSSTVMQKTTELVKNLAGNEGVKTVASEGVTKLAGRAATGLAASGTVAAAEGTRSHNIWLWIIAVLFALAVIGVVFFVLRHKSRKEMTVATINADKSLNDIRFASKDAPVESKAETNA